MSMTETTITVYQGQGHILDVLAKERDGTTVLASPASSDLVWSITDGPLRTATKLMELSSATDGTLVDADTAQFRISADASDFASLTFGRRYYYRAWTKPASGDPILQAIGPLVAEVTVTPA